MKRANGIPNLFVLTAITVGLATGCTSYGKVSDRAYELGKALYSICNAKDEQRLAIIRTMIADERPGVAISVEEVNWLQDIVAKAESGSWDSAAAMAWRLMEDQQATPTGG